MKPFLIEIALFSLSIFATSSAWTTASSSQFHKRATSSTMTSPSSSSSSSLAATTDTTSTGFCTIIGAGRIGSLLSQGGNSLLLKRGDAIPEDNEGTPIFIATRNDSLDGIIADCPKNRLKDLVFLQNGYLDSYLEEKGLSDNTQSLLYLSVPALGVKPVDGITTVSPEGLTAATGVHAQALADLLASLDLKCNVVSAQDYKPAMFEKLM